MVDQVIEAQVVKNVPSVIQGEAQFNAMQRGYRDQISEQLKDKKTNEELKGKTVLLTLNQYNNVANGMRDLYEEKYKGEEKDDIPFIFSPNFQLLRPGSDYITDEEYQSISERAAQVYDTLKLYPTITSRAVLSATLKEAYHRVKDKSIKDDIRRLHELISYDMTSLDRSEVMMDCLIDSPQKAEDYQCVFTKLLTDEWKARIESQPIIREAQKYKDILSDYCRKKNIDLNLPDFDEITYVEYIENITPKGPIVEREYERVSNVDAIIQGKDDSLDKNKPFFVMRKPYIWNGMGETQTQINALNLLSHIVHESIHHNAVDQQEFVSGSWEEAANELVTDYTTLTLFRGSGLIADNQTEERTADWQDVTGYHQFVKLADNLVKMKTISEDEFTKLGLDQDYNSLINLLTNRLQATPRLKLRLIQNLERTLIIGPDQYEKLLKNIDSMSAEDLFRSLLEFKDQLRNNGSSVLFVNVKDSLPDWRDKSYQEFMNWLEGTEGDLENEVIRQRRMTVIRKALEYKS